MTENPEKPKRRLRYPGTHPRRFSEKYKELHPEQYPEAIDKVLASGKTPAGTHRPICVTEILEILAPQPGEIAVDATLGYGGHAERILPRLHPGGRLLGLDVDGVELAKTERRLQQLGFVECLTVVRTNFAGLPRVMADQSLAGVDLVLADLGCSSMQLDNPERGFSYKLAGPLDLRMNPARGQPASALLASLSVDALARLLTENADEPNADQLAQAIVTARAGRPIASTADLSQVIIQSLRQNPRPSSQDTKTTLQRVFQAIRIEVNDEFSALDTFLRNLPYCLRPGGRVAILSFHSGEDRRVKKAFQQGLREGTYSAVAPNVIRPSPEEIRDNPRAGSAKLRWAKRS